MAGRVHQTHSSETSAVGAVGFGCTERGLASFLPSTGAHAPGCQAPLTLLLPTPPDDGCDQAMIDWKLHAGWRLDGLLAGREVFASPALLLVQVERAGQSLDVGLRALASLLVRHGAIADADLITGLAACWGPAGRYTATITSARELEARSGKGRRLIFTWQIIEGPHAGWRVWQNINYVHESPKAQAIGQAQLGQVAQACLIHHTIDSADPLIGKPCRITIAVTQREPYPPENTIRKVEQAASRGGQSLSIAPSGPDLSLTKGESGTSPPSG